MSLSGTTLTFDAGEFQSSFRSLGEGTYVAWDAPVTGALLTFGTDASGTPTLTFDRQDPDQPGTYAFTKR